MKSLTENPKPGVTIIVVVGIYMSLLRDLRYALYRAGMRQYNTRSIREKSHSHSVVAIPKDGWKVGGLNVELKVEISEMSEGGGDSEAVPTACMLCSAHSMLALCCNVIGGKAMRYFS
jgi:hypothetical protein